MTVSTEKFQVFETIVVVDAVFMLELKHDFLFVPNQYTITLCEILVLTSGTFVRPIKIAYESFFDVFRICILTFDHEYFVIIDLSVVKMIHVQSEYFNSSGQQFPIPTNRLKSTSQ